MAPSSTVGTITIKNTHTVTVTAPVTIDQITVESGATLTTNASQTLTVNDGTGNDLTVDGTLNIAHNLANNGVVAINGTLQINSGGFVSTNAPTYAAGSTLVYNTGGSYGVGTEWTGNATMPGLGVPANVTIQNSTTVNMPNSNRGIAGNLNINSGALNLNVTSGDLYLTGDWTRAASATFTPNNRAVFFNGSGAQTVTITGGGTETFNYLLIQNSATLTLGASTNITVNSPGGLTLSSSAASNINLANRNITLSGGGNLSLSSGARAITSSPAGGIFAVTTADVTVTNPGTLSFSSDVTVQLAKGMNFAASGISTINGTLEIVSGGFVSANPPTYAAGSTLKYNSGGNYTAGSEWTSNLASGVGVPHHVQVASGTTLLFGFSTQYRRMLGNLDLPGSFALSNVAGGDLKIAGNWTRTTGTFFPNLRAVFFDGSSGNQTLSATGGQFFHYLVIDKSSGTLILADDIIVDQILTLTNGQIDGSTNGKLVTIMSNATGSISGGSSASYVAGNLRRAIAAGANTYAYPIGTASVYAPVSIDFGASTTAGDLTGFTADGDHPNLGTSTFIANKTVNRYWDFTVSSGLGTVAYDATFNWVSGDNDAGYVFATGQGGKYNAPNWTYPSTSNQTATSAKMTGLTAFSGFQMGNSCPSYTAVLSGDASICAGGSTNLSVAISGGTGPYTVVYSGGTVNSYNNADPIPVSPGSTTVYTLTSVTNNDGCTATVSGSATVTVSNPPTTADAGPNQTICSTTPSVTLAANTPVTGTGAWTVSGPSANLSQFSSATDPGATFTPDGGAGVYTLTWTISNAPCPASSDNMTVTVVAEPSNSNAGSDQAFCGTAPATLAANTPANGTGTWSVFSGPSLLASQFSDVNDPAATFTPAGGTGIYVLRWTISNPPCADKVSSVTLTFTAPATANAGGPYFVCGANPVAITATASGSGTWSGGAGMFASATSTSTTYTPTAGEVGGTVTLTWTTSDPDGAGPCTAVSSNATLTVGNGEIGIEGNGNPIADNDLMPSVSDNTDFGNALVTGGMVTRTFTVKNTSLSCPLALNGSPLVLVSGVDAADFNVTVSPASTVPANSSTTFTIVFDPSATGLRTATVIVANDDTDENPYNFSIQGTGTNCPTITFTATPTNACGSNSDGQIAITGVTGGMAPYQYSIDNGTNYVATATFTGLAAGTYQVKVKDANNCESAAVSVTVGSTPATFTANAGPDESTCVNGTIQLNGSIGGGASSSTWSDGGVGGSFSNATALSTFYTPPFNYSSPITITLTTNGPCPASDNLTLTFAAPAPLVLSANGPASATCGQNITITIKAEDGFDDIASDQFSVNWDPAKLQYVSHTNPSVGGDASGVGTFSVASGQITYAWFDGTAPNGEDLPDGSTLMTITLKVLQSSGTVGVNITGTPTGIEATNNEYCFLTVNTQNNASAISLTPISVAISGDLDICQGENTTLTASGGTSYLWSPGGATTSAITVSPSSTTTYTVTVTGTGGCTNTAVAVVTVTPLPNAMISGDLNICPGESTTLTASGGGTYLWSTTETTSAITVSPTSNTTYTVTVTNSGCSSTTSAVVTVQPAEIVNAGPDQNSCVDGVIYINGSVSGGATGGTWSDGGAGGSFIQYPNPTSPVAFYYPPSGNTLPITLTLTSNGACPASDQMTVTYGTLPPLALSVNAPASATCGDVITVTVVANSGFSEMASLQYSVNWNQTQLQYQSYTPVSIGGAAPSVVVTPATGKLTYSWADNMGFEGENLPDGTTILTLSFKALTNSVNTTVAITGTPTAIEATTNELCDLTVNTTPATVALNPITVTCPADFAVCVDAAPFALSGGTPPGGTYSGPGVSSNNFNPAAAAIGPNTITYSYTDGNGCSNSCTFVITVNPRPTVDDPANQVVCNGAMTTAVNFTGAVPGTVYNWTNDNISIGLAASGSGNIAAFMATNTGTTPVVATITVTPSYTNAGVTCYGDPQSFTITVNPTPTVADPADQVVCNNALTTAVSFTGAVTGTTYNWTNDDVSIGLGASGSGDIAAFTATNTGTTPVVATITVTPVANGCTGASQTFTITVNPTPTVADPADQVVCFHQYH
ncbi:MAG: choice-of-anchor D domain-containing protein [Saprospiraceae bacterium]